VESRSPAGSREEELSMMLLTRTWKIERLGYGE
jgi:hypothetical protein